MELVAENDDVVRCKLSSKVKYTSSNIQNEVLEILSGMIISETSEELNSGSDFAVMMDESKDISKKEQGSVVTCRTMPP